MRTKQFLVLLTLLALILPASPAHAGGIVTVCDEAHLLAALAGGGTVTFACSGTITLTATITIAANTTINGSGQDVTISGNHAVRVFTVNSGRTLNLNGLTIANGLVADVDGGGIYVDSGTVVVSNSIFSGNSSSGVVGGVGGRGGGIYNQFGTVIVSNSTFSGNSATWSGAGIDSEGGGSTLAVSNSTFFGNSAGSGGGAIYLYYSGKATVTNATFSGNGSDIFNNFLYGFGTVTLKNMIARDCLGSIIDWLGPPL